MAGRGAISGRAPYLTQLKLEQYTYLQHVNVLAAKNNYQKNGQYKEKILLAGREPEEKISLGEVGENMLAKKKRRAWSGGFKENEYKPTMQMVVAT